MMKVSLVAFSRRERRVLAVAVLVVGLYMMYTFIFIPFNGYRRNLERRIGALEQRIRHDLKVIHQADRLGKMYKGIFQNFQQTQSDEQVLSAMISEIEQVARSGNMRIVDMKPKPPKAGESYNHFAVHLSIDGDLVEIMHFIYNLQSSPLLLSVDEMRLSKTTMQVAQLNCQLLVTRTLIP